MGQRIENESSDMVVKLLFLGQPRLKVATQQKSHDDSTDSQALDTDEGEYVKSKIQTDFNLVKHL
jgi:hypothetical protein